MTKRNNMKWRREERAFIVARDKERKARDMKKKAKKTVAMEKPADASMGDEGAVKLTKGQRRKLHRVKRRGKVVVSKVKRSGSKPKKTDMETEAPSDEELVVDGKAEGTVGGDAEMDVAAEAAKAEATKAELVVVEEDADL